MRPITLELDGFGSFRDPVTVDFTDADLFVLSGPTGAGKSTVVDAMTFALYGSVPRYDDRRLVAPVISQGRNEARVRLTFTVGPHTYTATRVVRRTASATRSGATTREARLERWHDAEGSDVVTLAGTADELTTQVQQLLGLTFDHFITCIVLPQGAFQEFLHARAKDRQDLLVELLDLSLYRRVGEAAREQEQRERQRAELLQQQLDGELADATEDEVKLAAARVEELARLLGDLDEAQPALDRIREEGRQQADRAAALTAQAGLLDDVQVPDGVVDLAARLDRARTGLAEADDALERAGTEVEACTRARQDAGDATPLQLQRTRLVERDRLHDARAALAASADATAQAAAAAGEALVRAEGAVTAATAALEAARHRDLVTTLVTGHAAGDPCPVCERPLETVPPGSAGDAVATADRALAAARDERDRAASRAQDARRDADRAVHARDDHDRRVAEVVDTIATAVADGIPDTVEAIDAALAQLEGFDQRLADARAAEQQARARRRTAHQDHEQATTEVATAWRRFEDTWASLAELGPPASDRTDLGAAWTALAAWASTQAPRLRAEADVAQQAVARTREQWRTEQQRLRDACAACGVVVAEGTTPRDAALGARERQSHRHATLVRRLAEATRKRDELQAARRAQRVAHELGQHLRSSNFEKWLLNRALHRLVQGATVMLRELSDGAYSLTLDDAGSFAVVDHRNADEVRSARTLSGGETFLASLALALALSEHVADLAAGGAARLESLILDEGFGTLDADTLDVVASALEELGSRGRMVGVITHVGALAERLPVRFDVRKHAGSSSIERVAT